MEKNEERGEVLQALRALRDELINKLDDTSKRAVYAWLITFKPEASAETIQKEFRKKFLV